MNNKIMKKIPEFKKEIEKEEEKVKKYDYGEENKLDISGNFLFFLGEGKRYKRKCKSNSLLKCRDCSAEEKFKCPFYERLRIEKYVKEKEGVKTHVFERDLTDNYVLLSSEKKRIKEEDGFLIILHDSHGPIIEYTEFKKDKWFRDRIIIFLRRKFYPFSAECDSGLQQQELIKRMLIYKDLILSIENKKTKKYIENNSEIIRRSVVWFIYYRWPLKVHGPLLRRLIRYFHMELF